MDPEDLSDAYCDDLKNNDENLDIISCCTSVNVVSVSPDGVVTYSTQTTVVLGNTTTDPDEVFRAIFRTGGLVAGALGGTTGPTGSPTPVPSDVPSEMPSDMPSDVPSSMPTGF